jgi:hypothetical protein
MSFTENYNQGINDTNQDSDSDYFDEDADFQIDGELDEFLRLNNNSVKLYDIIKNISFNSVLPIFDKVLLADVFELLYPNYENEKYFF